MKLLFATITAALFLAACAPTASQSATPSPDDAQPSQPLTLLRTPDARFTNLPGYPFAPKYQNIQISATQQMRIHYLDEGPKDGQVALLLHGEPSWSYLYRKMIPPLVKAGYRVIAPDLPGFGRSDKPARGEDYTYTGMTAWVDMFVKELKLQNVTMFAQDWGGLIGLRLVAFDSSRYSRVMISNTGLPDGIEPLPQAFLGWLEFVKTSPQLPVGQLFERATVSTLSPEIMAAYDAPFPDDTFKVAARAMPGLVPRQADQPEAKVNQQAWLALKQFKKPFRTAFSDSDQITKGLELRFQREVAGAQGQKHVTIKAGGHFVQEDQGEVLAQELIKFIAEN